MIVGLVENEEERTMMTWELLKRIHDMGEECIGEEYKLIKVNEGVRVGDIGMVANIGRFGDFLALANGHMRLNWLVGCEEWEQVEKKYYLQDTFINIKSGGFGYLNYDTDNDRFFLSTYHHRDGIRTKFTDEDIERLNIPSKYKKIRVGEI